MTTTTRLGFSPEFLAAIVENSDDAIVAKDLDGTILSWNEGATDLYGYSAEEAVGQSIELVIPEAKPYRDEELEVRRQIARGKRVRHMETKRRRRDGSLVDVSFSISPVKDEQGRIIAAAGFARDITDHNASMEEQQRLLRELRRSATVIENSDAAVVSKTLEGEILYWNKAATEMYKYTAAEAIGNDIEIVIPEGARRDEEQEIRRRIAAGEAFVRYETQRRDKNGRVFDVELSISPVTDETGEVIGAAGFARDITESRQEKMLADVVIHSDDAIVVKSFPDHKITWWNKAATELYGWMEEEAIGQSIDILIPDELQSKDHEIRERIRQGHTSGHRETVRKHRDGHLIDVSLSISPLTNTAGEVVGAARIARNITAQKRLEKERARATGLLERFVDFTAHDFKGPMEISSLQAQLALRALGGEADPEVRKRLQVIIDNTKWMWKRTEGLLKVVSLDKRQTLRKPVDADAAFDDSVSMLRSVYRYVDEATVTRDNLASPHSDEDLLRFLFQNLVQNACKFKRLDIPALVHATSYTSEDDGVVFALIDNGIGVNPGLRERLFEAYERDPSSEHVAGHGIGLNFCRRIVEWHGGRIWVEDAPGESGAAFKFTLPDRAL